MGDYENHISRLFFRNLSYCDGVIVEMGGDQFLLTIPSKTSFIDLETSVGWSHHKLQALVRSKYPFFDIRYRTVFVFDSQSVKTSSSHLFKADIKGLHPPGALTKFASETYDFVPALVPLTRSGMIDTNFAQSTPTGEFITAGHLLLKNGYEMTSRSNREFLKKDGPIQLAENTKLSPLEWVSAGGILVCTTPVGTIRMKELWESKLCPNLSRDIPTEDASDQTLTNPIPTFHSYGTHGYKITETDGDILLSSTGNPDLDNLLLEAFLQNPGQFEIGQTVQIKLSEEDLAEMLEQEFNMSKSRASTTAIQFKRGPATVNGVNDLQHNGKMSPVVTLMIPDGTVFPFPADIIEPVKP